MTRYFRSVLIASSVISAAAVSEVELNHELDSQMSIHARSYLGIQGLHNRFSSQFDYSGNQFEIRGIVQFEHEQIRAARLTFENNQNYSTFSRPLNTSDKSRLALRELYLTMPFSTHYLSVGKQQIVWGKADGVKILDIVNPQDFNEFILDEVEKSRIPLWLLNLELSLADDILQILWIPDTSTHQLPTRESSFAITSPRLSLRIPENTEVTIQPNNAPKASLNNGDIGVRWSIFRSGWDIALNYLFHHEDLPVFDVKSGQAGDRYVEVSPRYFRSQLYGGSVSKPFGNATIRSELAYETNQRHYTQSNTTVTSDELNYVIGLDYFGFRDTLVSGQFIQSVLVDVAGSGLFRPKFDTGLSVLLRKYFRQETLSTEIQWLQNMHENDGLIRPRVHYIYSDNLNLSLGADIFYGESAGLYGQFDEQDRLTINMRWSQ